MQHLRGVVLPLTLGFGLAACGSSEAPVANSLAGGGTAGSSSGASGGSGGVTGSGGTSGTTATTGGGATGGGATGGGATGGTTGGGTAGGTTGGASGTAGAAGGTSDAGAVTGDSGATSSGSVVQHHGNLARDGVYVDARLTRAAAMTMHLDPAFANTPIQGQVYAQPLYLAGVGGGPDVVIVATAQNRVYALNARTGANVWDAQFGTPVTAGLCGRPLNPLGITGTPVIDAATRTLYFNAMTATAANGARHMIHAIDIDGRGVERANWPIDVTATARSGATTFDSPVQNQRAALTLLGGKVFVSYGGHIGDCLGYHGWIVGVTTAGAPQVSAWATTAFAGGIWGSSGLASDGTSLFAATGNTKAMASSGGGGTTPGNGNWGGGEAVIKFPTTLVQPAATQVNDYFVPAGWPNLDTADDDIGGTGAVLFDVPGATPSKLAMALGKDSRAYLLSQANLGGLDAQPLAGAAVANGNIINAAVAYTTSLATYVVFRGAGAGCPAGQSGGLTAIKVSAASPPALSIAWCGGVAATSSPSVSMTSSPGSTAVLWYTGTDGRLHGVDGDTGQSVLADTTALGTVTGHQAPIIANGRIFVASNNRVFAFTP